MQPTVKDLTQRGSALARRYGDASRDARTGLLRELAEVIVELRSRFETEDGMTDWTGRTYGYREAVADIYKQSGLGSEDRKTMQNALRYHIGNVLRERAPDDELKALGLRRAAPSDRVREQRERLSALARLGSTSDLPKSDPVRLATAAEVILQELSRGHHSRELTNKDRTLIRRALERIAETTSHLQEELQEDIIELD